MVEYAGVGIRTRTIKKIKWFYWKGMVYQNPEASLHLTLIIISKLKGEKFE